jgi:hypothetical protein
MGTPPGLRARACDTRIATALRMATAVGVIATTAAACEPPPPAAPPPPVTLDITMKVATGDEMFYARGLERFDATRPTVSVHSFDEGCDPQVIEDELALRFEDTPNPDWPGDPLGHTTSWTLDGGSLTVRVNNQPWCLENDNNYIVLDTSRFVLDQPEPVDNVIVHADSPWAHTFNRATFVK